MSSELARMNYISELNEWVQLVELLRDTPLPRVVGAEDWTNFEKLTDSCRQAFERYLSAQREYAAAAAQHQHPQAEPGIRPVDVLEALHALPRDPKELGGLRKPRPA
jgi:hypothetical protein